MFVLSLMLSFLSTTKTAHLRKRFSPVHPQPPNLVQYPQEVTADETFAPVSGNDRLQLLL